MLVSYRDSWLEYEHFLTSSIRTFTLIYLNSLDSTCDSIGHELVKHRNEQEYFYLFGLGSFCTHMIKAKERKPQDMNV